MLYVSLLVFKILDSAKISHHPVRTNLSHIS